MSTTDLAVMQQGGPIASAAEIRAQVNLIQEVMKAVMIDKVHFGVVPGTDKPTLLKPGSEKILSTFRIAIKPIVEDLSTMDEARYRVTAEATSQMTGAFLGAGVGECSSSESKYSWRAAVCQEEFDATPEDRRRLLWKGGNKPYQVAQVRTNHADLANTVLKMAKKRAQIDVTLTVTAASDVFAQDIEDLPDELRQPVGAEESALDQSQARQPTRQAPPRRQQEAAATTDGPVISELQAKRFFGIAMSAGHSKESMKAFLQARIGTDDDRRIPKHRYDELCKEVQESHQ